VAGITQARDLLFLAGPNAGGTIGPRTPEIAVKTNGVRWHILNHKDCARSLMQACMTQVTSSCEE